MKCEDCGKALQITEHTYEGAGKRKYYLARADLARRYGNDQLADSYEKLAGALPWSDNNE
jgi:hypothetical protein